MPTARPSFQLETIVSNGELGTDRAALDFAMAGNIRHFGFCVRGRHCEDGRLPLRYNLIETASYGDAEAIFLNISCSDGTIIFDSLPSSKRSLRTVMALASCKRARRPFLMLQSDFDAAADTRQIANFLTTFRPASLHITGRTESEAAGISAHVATVLSLASIKAAPLSKILLRPSPMADPQGCASL